MVIGIFFKGIVRDPEKHLLKIAYPNKAVFRDMPVPAPRRDEKGPLMMR